MFLGLVTSSHYFPTKVERSQVQSIQVYRPFFGNQRQLGPSQGSRCEFASYQDWPKPTVQLYMITDHSCLLFFPKSGWMFGCIAAVCWNYRSNLGILKLCDSSALQQFCACEKLFNALRRTSELMLGLKSTDRIREASLLIPHTDTWTLWCENLWPTNCRHKLNQSVFFFHSGLLLTCILFLGPTKGRLLKQLVSSTWSSRPETLPQACLVAVPRMRPQAGILVKINIFARADLLNMCPILSLIAQADSQNTTSITSAAFLNSKRALTVFVFTVNQRKLWSVVFFFLRATLLFSRRTLRNVFNENS